MLCAYESGGWRFCFETARWQIEVLTQNRSQHTPDGMGYNLYSPVACARRELGRGRGAGKAPFRQYEKNRGQP
jgi:hypothetical protein